MAPDHPSWGLMGGGAVPAACRDAFETELPSSPTVIDPGHSQRTDTLKETLIVRLCNSLKR